MASVESDPLGEGCETRLMKLTATAPPDRAASVRWHTVDRGPRFATAPWITFPATRGTPTVARIDVAQYAPFVLSFGDARDP